MIAATNSQVAARVNPRLIDLIAALATGAVGSVALVRRDISDTLPGVAIAISLVPPLSVVGLTAESGEWDESFGALFLFATNVASILTTGIIVMALFKVYAMVTPAATPEKRAVNRRNAILGDRRVLRDHPDPADQLGRADRERPHPRERDPSDHRGAGPPASSGRCSTCRHRRPLSMSG